MLARRPLMIAAVSLFGIASYVTAATPDKPAAKTQPAANPTQKIPATQAHIISAAKLIIGDVKENQTFYEKVFGMKEVGHYSAKEVYDEPTWVLPTARAWRSFIRWPKHPTARMAASWPSDSGPMD